MWGSGILGLRALGVGGKIQCSKGKLGVPRFISSLGSYNTQEIIKVLLGKYLCSYNTQEITIIKVLF